jgi:hypothetical protein
MMKKIQIRKPQKLIERQLTSVYLLALSSSQALVNSAIAAVSSDVIVRRKSYMTLQKLLLMGHFF